MILVPKNVIENFSIETPFQTCDAGYVSSFAIHDSARTNQTNQVVKCSLEDIFPIASVMSHIN